MSYEITTEADRLNELFARGEITLDDIIERAVSHLVANQLRYMSFSDGSEYIVPCPWITAEEAA